jgi:hypothetical protein
MLPNIIFECKISRGSSSLDVTYTIKNEGATALGAFNRLHATAVDGESHFSPDTVFVELDGDTLHLMKMALPIPRGLQISAYVMPHASSVPAGQSFTETFVVALPAKERHPFKRALTRGEVTPVKPATAKRVRVTIGVFLVGPEFRLVAEHPAYPDVLTAQPPAPARAGQVLLSQDIALNIEVPVLEYQGFPWT